MPDLGIHMPFGRWTKHGALLMIAALRTENQMFCRLLSYVGIY